VETAWTGAVCLLGGDRDVAAAAAADLGARYAESHRRYHGIVHGRAVVRDVAVLAAELVLATAAHAASPDDLAAWVLLYGRTATPGAAGTMGP
jgi:predicted metal-dependent HD superfamily phosphohydrolase